MCSLQLGSTHSAYPVVYNVANRNIEYQVPVSGNVQGITISRDNALVLVSYKGATPPESWTIDIMENKARLRLLHTYMLDPLVDWAGPTVFGCVAMLFLYCSEIQFLTYLLTFSGNREEFVVCASKSEPCLDRSCQVCDRFVEGDVYIWDRESRLLVHSLQDAHNPNDGSLYGALTSIAWNCNSPGQYRLAVAAEGGQVRLWTAPALPETRPPSRAGSPVSMAGHLRPDIKGVTE